MFTNARGGAGGATARAVVTIPHADILALPVTPFPLVGSPGPSSIIVPTFVHISAVLFAGYTNLDADAGLGLVWQGVGNTDCSSAVVNESGTGRTDLDTLLAAPGFRTALLVGGLLTSFPWGLASIPFAGGGVGEPLSLFLSQASGALTGGNAGNFLVLTVGYMVIQ